MISVTPDPTGPFSIVIFGSSGDLAHRKLLPALFALKNDGRLKGPCAIVGFSRKETTTEAMIGRIRKTLSPAEGSAWKELSGCLRAFKGDYASEESYAALKRELDSIDRERGGDGNRLFYLAVPPTVYSSVISGLSKAGLIPRGSGRAEKGWTRVVIEKPFGRDLVSALMLNDDLSCYLSEDQVYRIDHYLGKETVQNIIVLRFGNGIFEPLWNRRFIDHVQITVAETDGVGSRAGFYEKTGALRDMVQNHLLQLLSLVAMEPPVSFDADTVRDEKVKLLRAVRPLPEKETGAFAVRGQYGEGKIAGKKVASYRSEPGVATDSPAETFVALKLLVDNWRWAGVPFYLRTGKRLPVAATEILIRFTRVPHLLFRDLPAEEYRPNELLLRIQPDEGISLKFGAKAPGSELKVKPVTMDFSYARSFGAAPTPAYERLLLDAFRGDASLFIRADGIRETWRIVQPLLDAWRESPPPGFPNYAAGTWGPEEANFLITNDDGSWRNPEA